MKDSLLLRQPGCTRTPYLCPVVHSRGLQLRRSEEKTNDTGASAQVSARSEDTLTNIATIGPSLRDCWHKFCLHCRNGQQKHTDNTSGKGKNPMIELGYALSSEEHSPNDLVRYAQRAEEAGFAFALSSDHYHPWID